MLRTYLVAQDAKSASFGTSLHRSTVESSASAGGIPTRSDLHPTAPCVERCSASVNTELPPSFIPTLPGHAYTDPTIFEQEQARSSRRTGSPLRARPTSTLPARSAPSHVGRENVLIVRGRDKKLRAFLNVCRHRGARVCTEERGAGQRSSSAGTTPGPTPSTALVAAPNLTQMEDVDRIAVRADPRPPAGVAGLRLGVPGRRAAVVRGPRSPARSPGGSVTPTSSSGSEDRPARASAGASPTTWRRTGSRSSRTSWSATTARRSTPSSPRPGRSSPTASPPSTSSATAPRSATNVAGFTIDGTGLRRVSRA